MITRLLQKTIKTRPIQHFSRQFSSQTATKSAVDDATFRKSKYLVGDSMHGFVCTNVKFIKEFNMTAYVLKHEKTGLEYLHVDRPDSNNVFSINFRTTPMNSTGLPHILEHNVLCGSERFPVRDPFFKMLNRSLATFMNAMTGPDYTLYPFSSTNETDYRNLMGIYCDAVFKPNLKYLDFLQEGWRLEHSTIDDKNSPLIFKGVVYNEMKGAFSENSAVFGENFFNKILPDHTYGVCSGGDPIKIPELTHKDLVEFHQKYYHPSNARMFSYGNFQLEKTLDYVNSQYLGHVNPIDASYSVVPNQKRWTEPRSAHITCRFDNMGAPFEKQNQIGIGFLMSDIRDTYENFVIYVLTELLVKGPNSYFYKSLIEPNISGGYNGNTGFESNIKDTMFTIGLQDIAVNDFERVQTIFDQTIQQVVEQGFDKTHLEGILHNIELMMKHQTPKFGLGLLFNLTALWNHGTGSDLISSMEVANTIARFRKNLAEDPKYLEKKVEQYFIKNKHKLTLTMSPDKDHEAKFAAAEQKLLQEKVDALTETDKERVFKDGLALLESQKSVENMEILPCLKLSDIKTDLEAPRLEKITVKDVPTQICLVDTNGVTYFRSIFDASELEHEEKVLLPLFCDVVSQFGTKKTDFRTFDTRIKTKTAGLSFSVHLTESLEDPRKYQIGLMMGTYCLNPNNEEMFSIISELLNDFHPEDTERFEMLLQNYLSNLSCGIAQSGHMYAISGASGLVTEAAALKEEINGIKHLEFMNKLTAEATPAEILEKMRKIAEKLFKKGSMSTALNLTENDKKSTLKTYEAFLGDVCQNRTKSPLKWHESKILSTKSIHNEMTIPVNYCAKAFPTVSYTHPDFAKLRVLAKLISAKYLLPVVREQNGAYGAGAKLGTDSLFSFYSYRDPNSTKTLDVFDETYNWIKQNDAKFDEQTLFEAKLGVLQQIDAPIAPMDVGIDNFSHGLTHEMRMAHRKNILGVTKEDLMQVAEKYLKEGAVKNVGKCVLGPENGELKERMTALN
ncbi:presequence protease, mitochondrial [Culicoides brevitarsis]|uniref:presequence protease, mitochondrial n=1 Tax=Culicoides brevitarsis TaxID=469753 RepID=UPI00307B75C6